MDFLRGGGDGASDHQPTGRGWRPSINLVEREGRGKWDI